MKPIKICIVSLYAYHYFNPKVAMKFGGAELQLYYLATEIAKDPRFQVHFITGDFGQPEQERREQVLLYKFFNPQRGLKYLRALKGFLGLWHLLNSVDADIYIQRAAGLETGEVALFCKMMRKKFVYMVAHDEDLVTYKPTWIQKGFIGSLRWKLFQMGLRIAHTVIVQHQEQKELLKKNYRKEGIIRLSAHRFQESGAEAKKMFVLWVARAEEWKQPHLFLDLAERLPEQRFVMVMPKANAADLFFEIKRRADSLSNLKFVEYVPFDKMSEYFREAALFTNTSRYEGFPNTFVQAAIHRAPILSLAVNPDGMLEKYKIGRCTNGNFGKMIEDMKELLNNHALRREMGENAHRYAREHHDIKTIVEEDKKLFLSFWKPSLEPHIEH